MPPPRARRRSELHNVELHNVELRDLEPVRVSKTRNRGELRVTNPHDHWVRFLWGTFRRADPDGRGRVKAFQTVKVRVHRHRIDWIALIDGYRVAGQGSVRDIRLRLPGSAPRGRRARACR